MFSRSGSLWLMVLGSAFAIAGSLFTVLLWHSFLRAEETRGWSETPCKILSSIVRPERSTPHSPVKYKVTVRYEFEFGGKIYTSEQIRRGEGLIGDEDDALALREKFSPSQLTQCWVNPAEPEKSVLLHGTRAALYSIWFPLLFVLGGSGMAWRAFSARNK
jgi:Protein of unknown function (DUF3592)